MTIFGHNNFGIFLEKISKKLIFFYTKFQKIPKNMHFDTYLISILAEEKRAAEVAVKKSKKDGIWGLLLNGRDQDEDDEGGVDFSLGNVLRIMLFTKKKDNGHERHQLIRIAESLDTLAKRLDHIGNIHISFWLASFFKKLL